MSENAPEPTDAPEPATGEEVQVDAKALAAKVEKLTAESRKWEERAKANAEAAKKLADVERQNMSEVEKAVAEAEARGRTAAVTTFGQRLAGAQFVAEAAKRNPDFDAAAVLEDLNLAKYVTEDGEPDAKGIAAAVERLVPERDKNPRPAGDVGLGPRITPPAPTDGSPRSLIAAGIAASDAAKR